MHTTPIDERVCAHMHMRNYNADLVEWSFYELGYTPHASPASRYAIIDHHVCACPTCKRTYTRLHSDWSFQRVGSTAFECIECNVLRVQGLFGCVNITQLTLDAIAHVHAYACPMCACKSTDVRAWAWVCVRLSRMTHSDHIKYGFLSSRADAIMKYATHERTHQAIRSSLMRIDTKSFVYSYGFDVACLYCAADYFKKKATQHGNLEAQT